MAPNLTGQDHRDRRHANVEVFGDICHRLALRAKEAHVDDFGFHQNMSAMQRPYLMLLAEHSIGVFLVLAFGHELKVVGPVVCSLAILVVVFIAVRLRADECGRDKRVDGHTNPSSVFAQFDSAIVIAFVDVWTHFAASNASNAALIADFVQAVVTRDLAPMFGGCHRRHCNAFSTEAI